MKDKKSDILCIAEIVFLFMSILLAIIAASSDNFSYWFAGICFLITMLLNYARDIYDRRQRRRKRDK